MTKPARIVWLDKKQWWQLRKDNLTLKMAVLSSQTLQACLTFVFQTQASARFITGELVPIINRIVCLVWSVVPFSNHRPIEWKSARSLHCCNLMFHCGSFLDQLSGECLKYSEGFLTVHGAFIDDYTFYLEFNSEVKNSYFFSIQVIKQSKTEYSCEKSCSCHD